ncbi:MAG: hypothetical protein WC861_05625 [Candidatus Micrarchaeia archaeon]
MASDLKRFLSPNLEKSLLFLCFALVLIPAAYFLSKDGIYCYPGASGSLSPENCEQAQFSYSTWHASWVFVLGDALRGILAAPFFGALFSYLVACSLAHFLEPKLAAPT